MTPDLPGLLGRLSLEQKVGQMFMLAFAGPTAADATALIREHYVGACYLSNDNLRTPEEAALLTADLQALAQESSGVPMLLAADQEGAWAVLTPYSCPGPGNMGLGATSSEQHTRAMYTVFGRELGAVGLNADLAPAADVNTNPLNPIIGMRSFGEKPDMVARHVRAAIGGLHDAGVVATAKHFPGHGDTVMDTHRGLAMVEHSREALEQREFAPFRAAVAAGVDLVMTAHVIFPALDPVWPATLSPAALTGVLRKEMGFTGVIVTDSFNMGAMRRAYDPAEAVVQTVQAGADLIMLAEERYGDEPREYLASQVRLVGALIAAARTGRVALSRIDEAVSRILSLKLRYGLSGRSFPRGGERVVGGAEHRAVERRAAEAAVVLVQNRDGAIPVRLRPGERIALLSATDPEGYRLMAAGRGIGPNVIERPVEVAFQEIKRRHANTDMLTAPPESIDSLLSRAAGAAVQMVVTEKYPLAGFDFPDESQHRLVQALLSRRTSPVVVLACRDPYELARFPAIDGYVCAMGYRPASVAAGVKVLFGESLPSGRLPVSVPGLYPAGWSAAA